VTALYVVATLFGVVDAFYWPTQSALVPHALPAGTLPVANSFIQTAQQLSMVLGPLLAGAVLQLRHFSWIFSIVAGLYAISVAAISFIRIGPAELGETAVRSNIWTEVGDGVRYVLGIRILLFLMLASMLINLFFMGPVNIGLPSLVQDRGWSGTIYGYLESAIGLGAVAGGGFTVLMKGMRGHFRWIAFSAAGIGLGLSAASVVTHWEWGVVFMAASGAAMSITNIPVITYVQTIVEKSMMGRVMSLLTLMSVGLTPVSYGLSALILRTRLLSPQGLMMVGGLGACP
jgi:MFS family permease